MHKLLECLGELLYPPRCPVCDKVNRLWDKGICKECLQKIRYVKPPRCLKCGKHIENEAQEFCTDCEKREHCFTEGRALFVYKDIARSVHRFKYQGRREYASVYGSEMAYYLGDCIRSWHAQALIPIPLYPKKERRRGYNQAALLAKALGTELGIPVYEGLVKRIRNTTPLKQLNPEERLNNLKKAFILAENGVKLKRVIIVDDIYTTGSTLDAVSKLLKEWGVEEIFFVTLAIGENV